MSLEHFHPAVASWFRGRFAAPTEPQERAWPAIRSRRHTLIAAPTGSGKTLAAFLAAIDELVRRGQRGPLEDATSVVYVSPLKALSNDIQRNLEEPLAGIQAELEREGLSPVPIRVFVRTGDTPAAERAAMAKRPPHIVVTTPESLYILLTSESGRRMLRTVRTVIVDEIHAVVDDRRGSHLALSLERLEALVNAHAATQTEGAGRAPGPGPSQLAGSEGPAFAQGAGPAGSDGTGLVHGGGPARAASADEAETPAASPLVRIGLSATQRPIEEVARFLVGAARAHAGPGGAPDCTIVDTGHVRHLDLALELPGSPLTAVMSNEVWKELYDRLAALVQEHRTTLIFVSTRRLSERVARHLGERIGEENVASHHGSLAREHRLRAERRLKAGELRCLVATASLELGIDIGSVELVCQIGSPRSIAGLLQRVGRSGHSLGGRPKGRLFVTSRDDLVECAALLDAVRRGELDLLTIPLAPLDILAQQIVAAVSCEEWDEQALFELARRAWPYRDLTREDFDAVVRMLALGYTTRNGRRGAHLHHDAVNRRLRPRRGARLVAVTSGGAIPDTADYQVVLEPSGTLVGTVNEDFAIESLAGDIFQLGNSSWRIIRVEPGRVRVEDAHGQPPTIPFWTGEAPGRTAELSHAVSRLREEIDARLNAAASTAAAQPSGAGASPQNAPTPPEHAASHPQHAAPPLQHPVALAKGTTPLANEADTDQAPASAGTGPVSRAASRRPSRTPDSAAGAGAAAPGADAQASIAGVAAWLVVERGLDPASAEQIAEYLASAKAALGAVPTQSTIVLERFFDETGGMQLVVHSPYGSRLNRAWGLALRKRFCRKFNFELQAAATEEAIVLSLGPTQSFPLGDVARYLSSATVKDVLVQALLDAPVFTARWRWNATRSLAVPRFRGGRKLPAPILRFLAEDLLAGVFPDQLACAENLTGDREIPDHPLVRQTIRDCLEEAMDADGLIALLGRIERGEVAILARDLTQPSPLAFEVLGARPYAFLDDAPLEERRTQAVAGRRWLDAETASDLGALDEAAIAAVREEAWPQAETADELHDALSVCGFLAEDEARPEWRALFEELVASGRAAVLLAEPAGGSDSPADRQAGDSEWSESDGAPHGSRIGLWIAAERLAPLQALYPAARVEPPIRTPALAQSEPWTQHAALVEILRARLEILGPVTAQALAEASALPLARIEEGLSSLEVEGFAMQGRFTPGARTTEWCARRLLARIHRRTLDRLRREIEPVAASDFIRFLAEWQGVACVEPLAPKAPAGRAPDRGAHGGGNDPGGPEGASALASILEQLEGFEAPAAAWEEEVLPARMPRYDPAWLDALCLSGRVVWMRLRSPKGSLRDGRDRRAAAPVRTTPICLFQRANLGAWCSLYGRQPSEDQELPFAAMSVRDWLRARGASFFDEIVRGTGLLRPQVEDALGELVARGAATSDSFAGLRALLTPSSRRARPRGAHRGRTSPSGMESAGRWALVSANGSGTSAGAAGEPHALGTSLPADGAMKQQTRETAQAVSSAPSSGGLSLAGGRQTGALDDDQAAAVELLARVLLRRHGVVFRTVLEREAVPLPWRDLLRVYRRMEARGEIRGGRFVAGFSGEQFALPDAVGTLRRVRRTEASGMAVAVGAADPLNVVGILTPGARVPAAPANRVLYEDGVPVAVLEGGEARILVEMDEPRAWAARRSLLNRSWPPQLRARLARRA